MLEIGPGRGILTRELARRCRRVIGVEKDPELCESLRERFETEPRVSIVLGDVLEYPPPAGRHVVVGNIPFNRTAAIVRRLTSGPSLPDDAWLVTQREAAHRFAGSPHATESRASLLLRPQWQVEIVRYLRRSDFDPPPRVDCAVLWLARRRRPLVDSSRLEAYRGFVDTSFGQGGNTIRECLGSLFTRTQIRRLAADLRFDTEAPPSGLTFDQWLALFRFLELQRIG